MIALGDRPYGGKANTFLGQPLEGDGDKWTLASFMLTIK